MDQLMQYMKDLPRPIENSDRVFEFLLGEVSSLSKLAPPDIASLCSVVGGLAVENHQKHSLATAIGECGQRGREVMK